MTDNYRDEMREALELGREYAKGALAAHDAVYQGHSATEAERVMIVDDIAKLDAALSRLSAQAEPAKDVRAIDVAHYFCASMPCGPADCGPVPCRYLAQAIANRNNVQSEPSKDALELASWCADRIHEGGGPYFSDEDAERAVAAEIERYVQARLSSSGQGEERGVVRYSTAYGDCGSCAELRKCKAIDDWCEAYKPAAPAPEKGNAQMADECAKAIDRINAMNAGRVAEVLDKPAPSEEQMDEETAWGLMYTHGLSSVAVSQIEYALRSRLSEPKE